MKKPSNRIVVATAWLLACWIGTGISAFANPTGGNVTAGSATITGQNTSAVGIRQASNLAVINWQTFSINSGESTTFVQPSAASATLNRVLGGQTSIINGSLTANGSIYLINGNGIIIGQNGVVSANTFTASTRDISDSDFLSSNLHFIGNNNAGVQNLGKINALGGDVVFIGKTVSNQGSINARKGTVGLVAGDDVLLGQKNADGSTITVNPSPLATNASTQVGVSNSGKINAAAAELKAANGNIYALAVQNSGTIRATTVKKQGGHIWLTSDFGEIVNSGVLDASANAKSGQGGSVVLKNMGGTTVENGSILAKGGQGGTGGNAEVSGGVVQFSGKVDLTAQNGTTGNLLFDPYNVTIENGTGTGNTDFTASSNDSIFYVSDLEAALAGANVTVSTGAAGGQQGDITMANALTWSTGNTLTLSAANNIYLNANITALSGGLNLSSGNNITSGSEMAPVTSGVAADINVASFILQSGNWVQNAAVLPSFVASNDFELQNSSSFMRVTGGDGSSGNPYRIADVYGVQGIASPSNSLLGFNFIQTQNISASNTATWNAGEGFIPIGNSSNFFAGNYNGQNYTITGLTINQPSANFMGLFGYTANNTTLQGINLVEGSVTGYTYVGGLAGYVGTNNTVQNCSFTGMVNGTYEVGGLLGASNAMVTSCYSGGTVNGGLGEQAGGLIGQNLYQVTRSYSTAAVAGSYNNGGLVGENEGTIQNCYATGGVSGAYSTGGLVGENDTGIVETSYSTGGVSGNSNIGGLVGQNDSFIFNCYATGNVTGAAPFSVYLGGLVGVNNSLVQNCYSTGAVAGTLGVGGLVGYNSNTIAACYWANDVGGNGSLSTAAYNTYGTIDSYTKGVPLASMKLQATFAPAGISSGQWDFTNTWTTGGDTTTPLLKSLSFNLSGMTTPGDTVDLITNGALQQTTTATGGNYSFLVSADVLSGALITDVTSGTSNTFYNGGFIPAAGTNVTGVNLITSALTIQGAGLSSNTQLGTAAGALTAGTDGIAFTVDTNHNLSSNTGIDITIQSPYMVDGNITATSAALSTSASAPLTASVNDVTLTGNTISLGASLLSAGIVNFNATGAITDAGSVQVGSFILQNGSWSQNSATLPAFSVTNDFEIQNASTFLRVAGGDGSTGNPYQIIDLYGLQGIASHSLLGDSFVLNNSIDASIAATWNGGAGFAPIGNSTNSYKGTFNGNGYTINNLTINLPSQDYVGLFGYTGAGSVFENVGIVGGSITGQNEVGGLVGQNEGTVQTSYATGAVNGLSIVGGLVGNNGNLVETSYATGVVTGNLAKIGGLVGNNDAMVETSYATGAVNGVGDAVYMGGLVGQNDDTVKMSYATGAVSGGDNSTTLGGLVGQNNGTVKMSYATGSVSAGSSSSQIGGLVGESDGGTVETSYATGAVTGYRLVGGLVGANYGGSTVETSYATGAVNGTQFVGGLLGDNEGSAQNSYWAQDTGLNVGLSGVGNGSSTGVSAETFAQLRTQSTYDPSWDFTLGSGVWGINGYTSNGLVNNGLPYFQWQYPTQAQITATNQQFVYSGSTGVLNQSAYTVTFASGSPGLGTLLSSGPTLSIVGNNVNVDNSGAANTIAVSIGVNAGYTVEVSTAPATVTYTPATLTYTADSVSRQVGQANPIFTGSVSGFVGSDTQGNATTGMLQFTSTANASSPAGSYAIDGSGLTADNGNYVFVQAAGNATALTISGYPSGQPFQPLSTFTAQNDAGSVFPLFFTQSQFNLFNPNLNGWLIPVFPSSNEPHPVYSNRVPHSGEGGKIPIHVIAFGSNFTVGEK